MDDAMCVQCFRVLGTVEPCCSTHKRWLCHRCYRMLHWVDVCAKDCIYCAAEELPQRWDSFEHAKQTGQVNALRREHGAVVAPTDPAIVPAAVAPTDIAQPPALAGETLTAMSARFASADRATANAYLRVVNQVMAHGTDLLEQAGFARRVMAEAQRRATEASMSDAEALLSVLDDIKARRLR